MTFCPVRARCQIMILIFFSFVVLGKIFGKVTTVCESVMEIYLGIKGWEIMPSCVKLNILNKKL